MPTTIRPLFVAALAVAALAAGCSAAAGDQSSQTKHDSLHADSAGGLVIAPSTPYTESTPGRGELVIEVAADSSQPADVVEASCEVDADSSSPGGETVVWVEGVRQGKPLSNDRRYELESSGCALSPRVQAVLVGGTVDVFNDDVVMHRLVFLRAGTNDTLQTMPFTNGGQIVATERLTKTPGIIEVRCAQHPTERAYIAVFDQPYFDVTVAGGKVTLDSVPTGDYRVRSWHEGLTAPTDTPAKVTATGPSAVIVR